MEYRVREVPAKNQRLYEYIGMNKSKNITIIAEPYQHSH
jgi:hypothetical protein